MLTVFSVPKPFTGHFAIIQENAIRSWTLLGPEVEVILFGDEDGTAGVADALGVRHEPELRHRASGAPLVSDVFARAQVAATHEWLCYVNCDIVMTSDLPRAVRTVEGDGASVLVSGRRWRLDVDRRLEFEPGWEEPWRRHVRAAGFKDAVHCMDYFVFRRGLFPPLPPFALGRGRWDSYLPSRARELGALFVDATDCVLAVHQNHGFPHPDGKDGMRRSPDAVRNRELSTDSHLTLGDATHSLTPTGLSRAFDSVRFRWRVWNLINRPFPRNLVGGLVGQRARIRIKALLTR